MKRLIIFLIRWRLGLKKFEYFRFTNQKTDNVYFFSDYTIFKMEKTTDRRYRFIEELSGRYVMSDSSVSLNWLLDDECKIVKLGSRNNQRIL